MDPLCFVLMPFGRKTDELGRAIDFDRVYQQIIAKAVAAAGMEPIRADEEQVGGSIHKPMYERLLLCEYAVADLTGANPNVYYELGIRHAMRPRSTVLLSCDGTRRPFDVAPLRSFSYRIDKSGNPIDAEATATQIGDHLRAVRNDHADDSPVFQLIDGMPRVEIAHERTDIFRERVAYAADFKERLDRAVRDGRDAVAAVAADPGLHDLDSVEVGIVVNLFLAHRAVEDFAAMVALYQRMPRPLQRTLMVREQYGLALNRLKRRAEAEQVLREVLAEHGTSSETCGLLGRVFKDQWQDALAAGDKFRARGLLKQALETYLAGFEADWRDPYPGINALTLFESLGGDDPRRAEILPVVHYAALRRARAATANYWDHATLLEIAVLGGNQDDAFDALGNALAKANESFAPRSTADNLRLIRENRAQSGAPMPWVETIEAELIKRAESLAQGEGGTTA